MTRNAVLESLVDSMTLKEQVSLLSGEDVWSINAIPRLGIHKLRVTDGPNGARGGGSLFGGVTAACFPVGIALGATWNRALMSEVGRSIAQEVKSKSAHVLLGPTINIQRSVTNGRNFECYSEDPELTSALAVAYINGLQAEGVSATPKHFVGNESEIERTTVSSDIDERTLREVYLRPFEAAIKEANTWAIMGSYNKINGVYAAENQWLLTDILRKEWHYDGIVMSDWFGSRTTAPTINAGMDLEMPGPTRDRGDALISAVESGEVSSEQVRFLALNVLRWMERCGALSQDTPFNERAEDRPEHRALIRQAGAEGTVLLKNKGVLPLQNTPHSLGVIGPNAKVAQIMGGGSSMLNPHYRVTPFEGLVESVGESALKFAPGCDNYRWEPLVEGQLSVEYFDNRTLTGEPVWQEYKDESQDFLLPPIANNLVDQYAYSLRVTFDYEAQESGEHRLGCHAAGLAKLFVDDLLVVDVWDHWQKGRTFFEEGCDEVVASMIFEKGRRYKVVLEFATKETDNLTLAAWRFGIAKPLGDQAIAQAVEVAKQVETALVFVGRSGEWDIEGSDLENITLPGRQDELVSAVAAVNPNTVVILQTGGPVEMPWVDEVAAVLQAWYPGQECGNALADVLLGKVDPSGRLPQTFPRHWQDNPTASQDPLVYPGVNGHVEYREGVFVGYRHYHANKIQPLFPFGHGLSYTRFELGQVDVRELADGSVEVKTVVHNRGDRLGSTVVQVYVGEHSPLPENPLLRLVEFEKIELEADQQSLVTWRLPARSFAHFNVEVSKWQVVKGTYRLCVGFSADDIATETEVEIEERWVT